MNLTEDSFRIRQFCCCGYARQPHYLRRVSSTSVDLGNSFATPNFFFFFFSWVRKPPKSRKGSFVVIPTAEADLLRFSQSWCRATEMYYYRYDNAEVSCCFKYLMFTYNIIFWLAGVVFIAVGFWAWSEKGVLLDLTQSQVRDWINGFFLANIKAYRDDIDLQNLIDSIQSTNHCCGAQEPDDWDVNVYFSCKGTHQSREKCGVPFSCCIADPADSVLNTQCGYDVRNKRKAEWSDHIYVKGCIAALEDWLPANLYILATVFVVISLLQVVGIYLARSLISDIQKVRLSY
ncbi:tetraspanin-14 isoform X4 [Syngnathoides biaculeatus]|uniref:tetraspanin-14 isoform X4 n=1 Tax=Syngnathoides biaculeatus TaxID=300417 RepID=UPI002ADD71B2|nr:tetraspanin-14 isoform X4 [Syngnathoides biaculeatus]